MGPRVGALFAGMGGLELGVRAVLGGSMEWVSEVDPAACRVLDTRHPGVPNLGDIAAVDWAAVARERSVDVLTGGFPCQDVSHAGARRGLGPGTRSGLWARMADAIDHLRPALVVAENVRGLLSAAADSDVEPCPWCMGGAGDGEPALRALGSVLADLADLGYDAAWHGLRAADVGAPHGRFRVFVLAWPATDTDGDGLALLGRVDAVGRDVDGRGRPDRPGGASQPEACAAADADRVGGDGARVHGSGERGGAQLEDGNRGATDRWGPYEPAVARWERILGRPAPAPTQPGREGSPQLSPAFVEWMLGLSEGWVTAVPGLSRSDMLRLLGNGVVPQQAAAALRVLLAWRAGAVAADGELAGRFG